MVDLVKVAVLILGVVIVGAGVVGLALGGPDLLGNSANEKGSLPQAAAGPELRASLPATDTVPPAKVETATFALG